jgi:steroid 5-alpha reductase family enzyme
MQNLVLGDLAFRMRAVGDALMGLALLLVVLAVFGAGSSLIEAQAGIVLALIGFWSYRAGTELRRVARTEGSDVQHLMNALGEIRKLYDLQFWIFLAVALLLAVSLLVAITGGDMLPVAW